MARLLRSQHGSALILTVIAMLILAVLGVSFALLADVESRMGVSYRQQAQAEALAEAGLERARDAVRAAVSVPGGFTNWFNGTSATHMLLSGAPLNNGTYAARIDNDCAAVIPGFPVGIEEPPHGAGAPCDNATDHNEVGVLTAWATSSTGRARVRAVVGVDNPWKHVCSNAKPDNNGYCNEPGNRNGSPEISPADPGDPNGPAAYDDLPRPVLGCSRVAPALHRGPHLPATQAAGCLANPLMYPHPYPVAFNAPPRFVLMGQDPAVDATAKKCNTDPGNPANSYFGYFDCALTTFCDPNPPLNMPCGSWGLRKACVRAVDTRVTPASAHYDPAHYVPYNAGLGQCGTGADNETGMVCMDWAGGCNNFNADVGSQAQQFTMYIFRRSWSQGNNRQMYGTLAVEGPPNPGGAIVFQVGGGGASKLWTGPNTCPAQPPWVPSNQYGFPLVSVIYNPELPTPTVTPTYAPQHHYADFGSANTEIHGMIFSGGHVQFNPLAVDGTIIGFEIQTQGSANYVYNSCYGVSTPPPGFPYGAGNQVVIIRKSFVVCANWRDDTPGPSACN